MMVDVNEKLPKAIDLSHHLSQVSKARQTSPLKGLARYFGKPGLISLAGGMPSPAYFPLSKLSADMLLPDSFSPEPTPSSDTGLSWFWRLFASPKERTEHMSIPKYADATPEEAVSLEVALQYGTAQGVIPLQNFMREFTSRIYQPQYSDFTTLVHAGNTDGWGKALQSLCNPGEMFITEEWTYPSALASANPYGVHPVSVQVDSEGMRSDDLRKLLMGWDEKARGAKRPHVMYTVPVGQNPTGATMGATRKKEIYNICVEFDIIIVEDDPYYFLQEGPYVPRKQRTYSTSTISKRKDEISEFVAGLVPSYLKFDYQGRVIRLDSFSKTVAPGSRLGWFTCNERFAERFERQGETSTQAPCGFGQSIIAQLVSKHWGLPGYVRWLRGLRSEYTQRRDFFIDELLSLFDVRPVYIAQGAWAGSTALVAYPLPRSRDVAKKTTSEKQEFAFGEKPIFSLVPPTSGMFVWLKIHFENHPSFTSPTDKAALEVKLWTQIAEAGVLIGPGWMFAATDEIQQEAEGHFRIAFSHADHETMKKAVQIFHDVLLDFFGYRYIN